MPFVFRCGRLVVLVLDARGDRDMFRKDYPILGTEQWGFIDTVLTNLPADVEALAVMTPTPIASMDPNGQVQNLLGDRTDDVVAFDQDRRGPRRGLIFLSGDIHVGCIFDISCSKPEFKAASLTASGISAKEDQAVIVGTFLDEDFTVAPGIRSTLREVTRDFNFGVVQVIPTGTGAEIVPTLASRAPP